MIADAIAKSRFSKLEGKLSHEKGIYDPAGLAAVIGRKKYGKKGMARLAHKSLSDIAKGFVSRKVRDREADKGDALPDGSFPIRNKKDLSNAEKDLHFVSGKKRAAAAALIERREKELGKSDQWMQGAVTKKHEGDFKEKAKKHHMTTAEYADAVLSGRVKADGHTKKQANLAQTFSHYRKSSNTIFGKAFIGDDGRLYMKAMSGVPAGTRPYAKRAVTETETRQVRAKAPRYGMAKSEEKVHDVCQNCGRRPATGEIGLCRKCIRDMVGDHPDDDVRRYAREWAFERSARSTARFDRPLSKGLYVRVPAERAEGFLKGKGYPEAQCKECGYHGADALDLGQHMIAKHPKEIYRQMDEPQIVGKQKFGKGMEFVVLDENSPEYHGHTGGGAGYSGKKWIHMHGPMPASDSVEGADFSLKGPKDEHRHFKMGEWTTHHSPDGYQSEILARHHSDNERNPLCALPNCGHPESDHIPGDDGRMACKGCNDRPRTGVRRNVRHSFRAA